MFYTTDGKLWRARWSHWDENSEGPVGSVTYDAARKFYYNGPRQRYLTQEVDPTTWEVLPDDEGPTQAFTTYLGDVPWADFTVDDDWVPSKVRDYLTGDGLHAQKDTADPPNVEFLHGDLIGSTMLRTDDSGEPVSGVSGITYTAFGEPVVFNGSTWQVGGPLPEGYPRYAYAGQFGYETDLLTVQGTNETLAPVTLAHVGWRWYQAGIGRFVQRDPAGVTGGMNAYLYCAANPLSAVDPLGLLIGQDWDDPITNGLAGLWRWWYGDDDLQNSSDLDLGFKALDIALCVVPVLGPEGAAASALAAEGETAEVVAVTAEAATKKGARGGVKLTVSIVKKGKTKVVDVVYGRGGGVAHKPHVKGPYPLPPWMK